MLRSGVCRLYVGVPILINGLELVVAFILVLLLIFKCEIDVWWDCGVFNDVKLIFVFDFYVHCELDELGFNVFRLFVFVFDEFILLFYFDSNKLFFVSESYKFFSVDFYAFTCEPAP